MQGITGLYEIARVVRSFLTAYLPETQWVDMVINLFNIGAIFTII